MHVLVFGSHNAPLLDAMAEGIRALGHRVTPRNANVYREGDYEPCDAAALFSLHGVGQAVLRDYTQRGTPIVVVDYGYVHRGMPHEGRARPDSVYFSCGLNGLNGHADFKNHLMPEDRWRALGVELKPWKTDGKYILVCGQKSHDAAIGNLVPRVWAQDIIKRIQAITTKPVVFRPHPMDPSQKKPIGVPHSEHQTITEALRDASACVAYNSNALVDAVINGVPAFALGPGSMVQKVCLPDLSLLALDAPLRMDRQAWAHSLAYAQWNISEMKQGLPWKHLFEGTPPVMEPATELQSAEESETLTSASDEEAASSRQGPKKSKIAA